MNHNELKKRYNKDFFELRKIINDWNLILECPKDEFDNLNNKILSQLYKDSEIEKINKILQSELIVYYGLFRNEFDSKKLTNEIVSWWNKRNLQGVFFYF